MMHKTRDMGQQTANRDQTPGAWNSGRRTEYMEHGTMTREKGTGRSGQKTSVRGQGSADGEQRTVDRKEGTATRGHETRSSGWCRE